MIAGIVDTSVLVHLFRNNPLAIEWIGSQPDLAITPISWLEFMYGAPGKSGQTRCLHLMQQFIIEFLAPSDQAWAMQQMLQYRLSHGASLTDCLIASVAYRLQGPVCIDNVKDFLPMLATKLVVKPY